MALICVISTYTLFSWQRCGFANLNVLHLCRSRCLQCRSYLSSQLLWSRNFATMVTWRHTSFLYSASEVITWCLYTFTKCFVQRYEEDMKQSSSGSSNYDGDVCRQSIKTLLSFCFFKFQYMAILTIRCNRRQAGNSFKPKCSLKLDH